MEDLGIFGGNIFSLCSFENSTIKKTGKQEQDIPLTDAGEIDHPLISKYSEFNYPPDLNLARMHGVFLLDLARLSCRQQIQPSEEDEKNQKDQERLKILLENHHENGSE